MQNSNIIAASRLQCTPKQAAFLRPQNHGERIAQEGEDVDEGKGGGVLNGTALRGRWVHHGSLFRKEECGEITRFRLNIKPGS